MAGEEAPPLGCLPSEPAPHVALIQPHSYPTPRQPLPGELSPGDRFLHTNTSSALTLVDLGNGAKQGQGAVVKELGL